MSTFRRVALGTIVLGLAAGAVRLGIWQLSRLADRRASNAIFLAGQSGPVLRLSDAPRLDSQLAGRRVAAVGTFLPEADLLLRGRVNDKAPGLEVMTPFQVAGSDQPLWVLRGFVPSPDATTPPVAYPSAPPGEVTIHGVMLAIPATSDSGQPLHRNGVTTYRRLDRGVAASRLPGAPPYYLLLEPDSSEVDRLAPVPLPPLNDGPHFSYALQWFGIALAILAFGFIALRPTGPARVPPPGRP